MHLPWWFEAFMVVIITFPVWLTLLAAWFVFSWRRAMNGRKAFAGGVAIFAGVVFVAGWVNGLWP